MLLEIKKASQRSADITRQLLTFASRQAIEPKRLDLNETVSNILKMLRRLIGENIELNWNPGRDVCPIRMDPSQFDQILINLCVNARDAMGEQARICIESGGVHFNDDDCRNNPEVMPGEFAILSVSDNGSGMDKQTLEIYF